MAWKENQSSAANNSLLQTARTKAAGPGKLTLLSHMYAPKDPLAKANTPNLRADNCNVVNATETESSVFGISANDEKSFEISLPKGFPGRSSRKGRMLKNIHQQEHIRPFMQAPHATQDTRTEQEYFDHRKRKKHVNLQTQYNSGYGVPKKTTMILSKGLKFSAPAPMTLNRCQPQLSQEKTAPESRNYLKRQITKQLKEQKDFEESHMADAKRFVDEQLTQYLVPNEFNTGIGVKKRSLVKKILGKVRPKPSDEEWQRNHKKSTAIEAAMAAAAAAVDAATERRSDGGNEIVISEEHARAVANRVLSSVKQRNANIYLQPSIKHLDRIGNLQQEVGVHDHTFPMNFPINEVTMSRNEDTVSDLDASLKNAQKVPVFEVHVLNTKTSHGSESISTLGTPRVFEQLNKLLSGPRDFSTKILDDDSHTGFSAAPPPIVTSHNAKALIDQLDSGTFAGDASSGTGSAEDAVNVCNIADHWCIADNNKTPQMKVTGGNEGDHDSIESCESSDIEPSEDETSNSALNLVIDNAIRKAEIQIATSQADQTKGKKQDHNSDLEERKVGFDSYMSLAAQKLDRATNIKTAIIQDENKLRKGIYRAIPREREGLITSFSEPNSEDPHFETSINLHHGEISAGKEGAREERGPDSNFSKWHTATEGGQIESEIISRKKKRGEDIMNQGRFLLPKDDVYWDTLSTIASTANGRSSSQEFMDSVLQPGPIPGEITAPSSDMKGHRSDNGTGKKQNSLGDRGRNSGNITFEENSRIGLGLSRSPIDLNDIMNDVTDLIDANLLDTIPPSPKKRSHSKNLKAAMSSEAKPYPEMKRNIGSSTKGLHSISWGFEEIFGDNKNFWSTMSERSRHGNITRDRNSQINREGQRGCTDDVYSETKSDDDLLSKTLEVSRGLLASIIGSQSISEEDKKEQNRHMAFESRDDLSFGQDREINPKVSHISDVVMSKDIESKLHRLRTQRSEALEKFRLRQLTANGNAVETISDTASKDKLIHCRYGNFQCSTSYETQNASSFTTTRRDQRIQIDVFNSDVRSISSESNASTTPSQIARDLRLQLDEAMRQSKAIQFSQRQLGSELNTFKQRYYRNVTPEGV